MGAIPAEYNSNPRRCCMRLLTWITALTLGLILVCLCPSDGKTVPASGKAGETRFRQAGEREVQNPGDKAFEGILVEMKGARAVTPAN